MITKEYRKNEYATFILVALVPENQPQKMKR